MAHNLGSLKRVSIVHVFQPHYTVLKKFVYWWSGKKVDLRYEYEYELGETIAFV